jgi:hypothetical protein
LQPPACGRSHWTYTPAGFPDTVYVIGSNQYGEQPCNTSGVGCGNGRSNGREVLYSDTAGDPDGANNLRRILSVANCNSAAVDLDLTDLRRGRRGVMFSPMREWLILVAHLVVTIIKIAAPGGARSVVAESLILKHQLLILNRSRKRAPRLGAVDRVLLGLGTLLVSPRRLT